MCAVVAILAMTLTMSGIGYVSGASAQVGTAAGGTAAGGGGGSSSGGGGGASSGGSSGGEGAGGATSAVAIGAPCFRGDTTVGGVGVPCVLLASTVLVPLPMPRPRSAAGLTAAQERTWDAFSKCATRGAMIDQLHVDGTFTFEAGSQIDARATKECMTRIGYHFDY